MMMMEKGKEGECVIGYTGGIVDYFSEVDEVDATKSRHKGWVHW